MAQPTQLPPGQSNPDDHPSALKRRTVRTAGVIQLLGAGFGAYHQLPTVAVVAIAVAGAATFFQDVWWSRFRGSFAKNADVSALRATIERYEKTIEKREEEKREQAKTINRQREENQRQEATAQKQTEVITRQDIEIQHLEVDADTLNGLMKASEKLDDVCRLIEISMAEFDFSTAPTGSEVAASLLDEWPQALCPVWREFTNRSDITVCIRKLHPRNHLKLLTQKIFPDSIKRKNVQPDPLDVVHTICGRAYTDRKVIIVPSLEDDPDFDFIQRMWPGILDHIRSVIAAPVWVRKVNRNTGSGRDYVGFVLQIDSPVKDVFCDNLATQMLTRLCAHKLGLVPQIGKFIDRLLDEHTHKRATDDAQDVAVKTGGSEADEQES